MTRVIKQLHSRDTRLHYCPIDHWLSSKVDLQVDLVCNAISTLNSLILKVIFRYFAPGIRKFEQCSAEPWEFTTLE